VQAVVHTHPEHATAFASLRVPLRPLSHEACLFVPPDVPRFSETSDLIVTAALGRAVARALGPAWALLLESHGIVTAGASVAEACLRALLLDKAARVQLLAGGRERAWTSDEEALAKRERIYPPRAQANVWAYLTRQLTRRQPGRTRRA
jgi:L-fuculose-phosphate aldolase